MTTREPVIESGIRITTYGDSVTFSHRQGRTLSVSELTSLLSEEFVGNWWYYNRLFVPVKARGQGIAKLLLASLEQWADENQAYVLNEINPYGDLDLDALIELYTQHGFEMLEPPHTMVRKPRPMSAVSVT